MSRANLTATNRPFDASAGDYAWGTTLAPYPPSARPAAASARTFSGGVSYTSGFEPHFSNPGDYRLSLFIANR